MTETLTEACECKTCQTCLDAEQIRKPKLETGYTMCGRTKERLLAQYEEGLLKRAVMDAVDHCLISETCPDETADYYLVYHETCMALWSAAIHVRKTIKLKKQFTDPKTVKEFQEALRVQRERVQSGKKGKVKGLSSPKHDTNGKVKPETNSIRVVKSEDPVYKGISKLLRDLATTGMLQIAGPMLAEQHAGKYDVREIAAKMGIEESF